MARASQKGLSLVELLVVLAVMALLAAIGAARLSGGSDLSALRGDAREMAAQLRRARTVAIGAGAPCDVMIDLSARAFSGCGTDGRLRGAVDIRGTGAASLAGADETIGVRFFPNGASSGARIELAAELSFIIINIDWASGRIALTEGEG